MTCCDQPVRIVRVLRATALQNFLMLHRVDQVARERSSLKSETLRIALQAKLAA
jgi:hypothetical protein